MRRILEVFGEPISRGGQESYVMNVLQHMDLTGFHIDMFTPYYCNNEKYIDYINSIKGVIVHEDLPFKVGGTRREIIPVFERYLQNNRYDVVHIHSGSISVLAYYARIASNAGVKKVIVHSHSSGAKENIKHILIKSYAAGIFKKYVTDYCACSAEAAKWKYPRSVLSKVNIMNNGIDLDQFQYDSKNRNELRRLYGIKHDEFVLGHVGRFTYEKNQIFLIDVLEKYISTYRIAKLVLVGDGDELPNVKRRVIERKLEELVIFTGTQDNVDKYMDMFDVFLFPSLYEGMGIVGIEAQASGLPVIASEGVPKTIDVTGNVHFCNINIVSTWCDEIENVRNIKRKNYRDKIKENGFDVIESSDDVRTLYLN